LKEYFAGALIGLFLDKGRPAQVREKRAVSIRQSRWLWIRFFWQVKENGRGGSGFVFLVGAEASLNKGDRKKKKEEMEKLHGCKHYGVGVQIG
jgi:hypothetical protein